MMTSPSTTGAGRQPFFVHRCLRSVRRVLGEAGLRDEAVLLGVSGGGDSMALLELVGLLAPSLGLQLHVACVDHGLRSEAAAEAEVVAEASRRWQATFHGLRIDTDSDDEDTLRRLRHEALEGLRARAACRFILLGHSRDDQIETIVLRFLRGAGLGGLAGMRQARGRILRPLLDLSRSDLRRLLVSRSVPWCEDPTNQTPRYARGRLRGTVLPSVEAAFGRGSLEHLLDLAPRWRRDEDYLEQEASRLLAYASRRGSDGIDLDAEALACGHRALQARVLRQWIGQATGRTSSSREIAAVERWLAEARRPAGENSNTKGRPPGLDLPGLRLERRGDRLVLIERDATAGRRSGSG